MLSTDEIISADANEKFILLRGDASLTQDSNLGTSSVDIFRLPKTSKIEVSRLGVLPVKGRILFQE